MLFLAHGLSKRKAAVDYNKFRGDVLQVLVY
jgi:hypothetical protein